MRVEASKESLDVSMDGAQLVKMFLDLVSTFKTLIVLDYL